MPSLNRKIFIILGIVVVLIAIPLTVMLLQKQQETRSRANKATTLCFAQRSSGTCLTSLPQQTVDQPFNLDIMMDPGTNQVISSRIWITYDPTKIAAANGACDSSLCTNEAAFSIREGPAYESGTAKIVLNVKLGTDMPNGIQARTRVATITLKPITQASNTTIGFGSGEQTGVTSSGADDAEVNVLSSAQPVSFAIAGSSSPTATPAQQPTATPTLVASTSTPTPPQGTSAPNQIPVCASLNIDRLGSGAAPFSITFTANGNDSDGSVQKVAFDFGDGPVHNELQGGGIGTKSVSIQVAHTYQNPGTFKATAVITDDKGGTSTVSAACSQTINVTQAPTPTIRVGAPVTPVVVTATPFPTATPTQVVQKPSITAPGPGDKIIGIGAVGIILSIIGGILFSAL